MPLERRTRFKNRLIASVVEMPSTWRMRSTSPGMGKAGEAFALPLRETRATSVFQGRCLSIFVNVDNLVRDV